MKATTSRHLFLTYIGILFSIVLQAQSATLSVIPEVQAFDVFGKNLSIDSIIDIVVQKNTKDSLMPIAQQLQKELQQLGIKANISQDATDKMIFFIQKKATYPKSNKEAYEIYIDQNITLSGNTTIGVYWGTRTLLQLIKNHDNNIPKGHIIDYPDYPNRGFMLDVGRKFFSIDFLKDYIKFMSYYKMNEFHIHLNDNGFKSDYQNDWSKTYAAFRLESETYPGLAATDGYYTKNEFRALQRLGQQYGVNVIPEIDIPAHSLAFTRYNPKLQANPPYAPDHLDILDKQKQPLIYDFFETLLDEYIDGENPTFVGEDVHIGTDEFIKEGDAYNVDNEQAKYFREFTQHFIDYVANKGKTPRLWGGLKWIEDHPKTSVIPNGKAIMNAWSKDWVDPNEMISDGFRLINTCDTWLYIVPKAGYYRDFLDTKWIYNQFTPRKISTAITLPEFTKGLLGATFAVWNDKCQNGISQLDVHLRVLPAMQVMATKTWNISPKKKWEDYHKLSMKCGEGVGLNMIGRYTTTQLNNLSAQIGQKPITLDGKTAIPLGGENIGYNYEVSFELYPQAQQTNNAILFQSTYGKITLNTNESGKIGFSRDGYSYFFNYKPINNSWQRITITADYTSVTLLINNKIVERLNSYERNGYQFQQTLHFPIQTLGDKKNGFIGKIKNLRIKQNE